MFTDGHLKQYKDWNCKMYALLDAEQGSTSKVDPVPVVRVHSSLLILEPD